MKILFVLFSFSLCLSYFFWSGENDQPRTNDMKVAHKVSSPTFKKAKIDIVKTEESSPAVFAGAQDLIEGFSRSRLEATKSVEGRTKFIEEAKAFAARGKESESFIMENYQKILGSDRIAERLTLLETATAGRMDPIFLKELGALELKTGTGLKNALELSLADRHLRKRLLISATGIYLAVPTPFEETSGVLRESLSKEKDPLARVGIISLYLKKYPEDYESIRSFVRKI